MRCSYITQSVFQNTILGLKMMVKSGLENICLKSIDAGNYFPLLFHIDVFRVRSSTNDDERKTISYHGQDVYLKFEGSTNQAF